MFDNAIRQVNYIDYMIIYMIFYICYVMDEDLTNSVKIIIFSSIHHVINKFHRNNKLLFDSK